MSRVCLLTFCSLALVAPGCQSPLKAIARATTGRLDAPNVAPRPASAEVPQMAAAPLVEPTREQAFAAVLDDLQEIGRENPAAQQQLLDQLSEADPAHWDGLVQRMKSNMQYHQHLVGEPAKSQVLQASSQLEQGTQPSTSDYLDTRPAAAPRPQQPSTWPAPPVAPVSPGAGPSADARRFDPALTQTSAIGVAPQNGAPGYPSTSRPTSADETGFAASGRWPVEDPATTVSLDAPAGPPTESQPPSAPLTTPPASWDQTLQAAIEQLEGDLREHPQSVHEAYNHVRLRLLQLAAGNLDAAAAPPAGLTATEQQYWSNQLLAVSTLLDSESQPEIRRRAAAGGLHLQNAVTALEQLGSLTVGHLRFCEQIYGFGAYQPVKHARFKPGAEVKVYAEVANFKTVTTAQGEHTSLATSYRVLDQHGGRVAGGDVPIVDDYCASRRRDFYIEYGITLPKAIYPGEYVLELTLTDQLGDKIGHGTIEFEIVASE